MFWGRLLFGDKVDFGFGIYNDGLKIMGLEMNVELFPAIVGIYEKVNYLWSEDRIGFIESVWMVDFN